MVDGDVAIAAVAAAHQDAVDVRERAVGNGETAYPVVPHDEGSGIGQMRVGTGEGDRSDRKGTVAEGDIVGVEGSVPLDVDNPDQRIADDEVHDGGAVAVNDCQVAGNVVDDGVGAIVGKVAWFPVLVVEPVCRLFPFPIHLRSAGMGNE